MYLQNIYTGMFSFFHNRPKLEIVRVSLSRKINKMWYIHTVKYYLVIKKMTINTYSDMGESSRHPIIPPSYFLMYLKVN